MSETTSAPAPTPAAKPTPTANEPTPVTSEPPVPAPEATPVETTAAAVAEPTPAPRSTPGAEVSAPAETTAAPKATATIAVPEPTQSVPTPTTDPAPIESIEVAVEKEAKDTDGKDASVEPQNTLTSKFTKQEWEALNKFRDQLPEILAQAFPDNPQAKQTSVNIWGVELDPQNPKDTRVSVVLMKFLRARNLSVPDARDMFVGTLRWRESFNIDAALKEEFPQDVFGSLGHIFGKDTGGRPIIYNIYGGNQDLKAAFGDVRRFIRWRVALMERSVFLLDFNEVDQTVQVHDYEGVSLSSRDANSKAAASEASNIFQSHYPEMLHKKFFINVPTILSWIFWAFKPLLSANTLAKMSVVGTGQDAIKKALVPYIKEEELPKRYGGLADAF